METQDFVDRLFSEYEESPELRDFKEELLSNLEARIASLAAKGLDEGAAFEKAAGELGDISALADQISLKKKQEVLQDAYLGIRKYLKPLRVAWYVLSGAWLVLGLVIALIVYLTGEEQSALEAFWEPNKRIISFLGVLVGTVPLSAAAFTFLGFTQETASRNPLSPKRAAWYVLAAAALGFGIFLVPLTYFATDRGLMEAAAALIPFAIPGLGLLIFLILTEKDTRKPWVRAQYEREARAYRKIFNDPLAAARFGMVSGALWIFALGLFLLLGFLAGFQFSWLVFVFAVAIQLAILGLMMGVRGGK
jgi:ABC-type glycerol-3-phosphate transport system permease component